MRSHYESVARVITAMKDHLDQPMPLHAMARIACSSPCHFNRTFRQVTGVPPSQFLYALRLDTARRLLMETDRKVIDICYEVGYNSIGTFTRRFTDLFGICPTTFRELAQATTNRIPENSDEAAHTGLACADAGTASCTISGYVSSPADFRGRIFVALFETPVPQARPVACAIAADDRFYQIEDAPEGEFYLFALGLDQPMESPASFQYESALRAGGQPVQISRKSVRGSTHLRLRPASPLDPPILLVMPVLIESFLASMPRLSIAGMASSELMQVQE
jgi:AraC-like DNA-binding protein